MSVSVDQFVNEYKNVFSGCKRFARLEHDLNLRYRNCAPVDIINASIAKLILGHHYDTIIEQPICKAFKAFARDHTMFSGGDLTEL